MALSQNERLIRIATPLGDDAFIVKSFSGTEVISKAFRFEIKLVSERNDITFDDLAGQNVTVTIRSGDEDRYFNGMIIAFSQAQISKSEAYSTYFAVMVPTLWAHTEYCDCRIFQDKTVDQIIESVLKEPSPGGVKVPTIDFEIHLSGTFVKRAYCVQYNESNFDFISRLCEEEGICSFFKHNNGHHILVFTNKPDTHALCPISLKGGTVQYRENTGGYREEEAIDLLQPNRKLTTGKYSARDYNFTLSKNDLSVDKKTQTGKTTSQGEIYEYPGGYEVTASQGNNLADIRMQVHDAKIYNIHGQSNCRGFTPGYKFKLDKFSMDEMNGKEYLLLKVRHSASQSLNTADSDSDTYVNAFYCMPHDVPFRSERITRKPKIVSSQTAIVTGPKTEEIHTDNYGRVKVRFHWDRRDTKEDGNMSCWIRVSQNWAGDKWGAMHIPRVGQEVIVNFLDGDPDRPIITGRVYRANNMPPYDLPKDKTKSTIMSSSTKNGKGRFNEICFEDSKGKEEIFTHAARNQKEEVENDMSTEVNNNQEIKVKNNRSITVASGNEAVAIESGSRDVTVKSNESHTNSANFDHKVSGNYTLKVNGNITIDASGIVKISGAKIILNG
jgi:type VI secretion system secreted protein VgrG